jgi:adenylate cyclase
MTYRAKVLSLFILLALLSNGILFVLLYLPAERSLLRQMQSKVLSIASTTAAALDTDLHQQVVETGDESSPAYIELVAFLREMRDANRREDVNVRFIYTIVPNRENPTAASYVLDAEEDRVNKSHLGENYKTEGETLDFERPTAPAKFIKDQFGTWQTAMVPLRDDSGRSIGALGVDVSAHDVIAQTRRLFLIGLAAITTSLAFAVGMAMFVSRRVSRPLATITAAVQDIGSGKLDTRLDLKTRDEFGAVATAINEMVIGLRQRDNLKSTLVSYVSQQVADEIMATGKCAEIRTERRKVTVLFADVRGFTSLSEKLNPEQIVNLLNDYFDRMIDAVFRHKGTLNKFIGDGLMAMFGAPMDDAYQEEHAIRAALDMQAEMVMLREKYLGEWQVDLRIGIGINTGVAVVGNIGSKLKMEYTAIGDTVNTASRLESKTKELGADILVSEYTYVAVRNLFKFKKGDLLQVKGKSDQIQVYSVEGIAGV